MKKIFLLLVFCSVFYAPVFSQQSFMNYDLQTSIFDLNQKLKIHHDINQAYPGLNDSKNLISNEEDEMMRSRRRGYGRSRGGSSDGGLYAYFGLGYGLIQNSENIPNFTIKTDSSMSIAGMNVTSLVSDEQIGVSLGKGLCINWGLGYMLNGNFGFELGMSYLLGGKNTATHTNIKESTSPFPVTTTTVEEIIYSANMFRINPSIVISSGMEGINPYAKFGMIIGIGKIKSEDNSSISAFLSMSDTTMVSKTALTTTSDGGIAIGFSATLGCAFEMNSNISFFGELNLVSLSYGPSKSEITSYTIDGEDQLANMTVSQKQINYYDILKPNTSLTQDMPSQGLKKSISFGSIGLNIGMRISF